MPNYKELRLLYLTQINEGLCKCILSGLIITQPRFLSLEHFTPCCRGGYDETRAITNVFPAYKIINNLKGPRLGCEWMMERESIYKKALSKGHLRSADREIVEKALDNVPRYNINPCNYCILHEQCY